MSEIKIFNRWTVKRWLFWLVVAGVPALLLLTFLMIPYFISPIIGFPSSAPGSRGLLPVADMAADDEYYMREGVVEEKAFAAGLAYGSDGDFAESESVSAAPQAITDRLTIRDGNINISVEDTRQARNAIEAIVHSMTDLGAYVVTASESGRGENLPPYISMVIRVPVEEFDSVMDQIAALGLDVLDSNEGSQDVTAEYVDLSSRVEALEAARNRLLEIMLETDTTEDLLQAEAQLTIREAEIEALKGRMKYLSESARLSRISIILTPYTLTEPIDTRWEPAETFRRAVEDLVDSLQGFADFLIYFVISVLPWFLFFGLIIWGIAAIVRRRRTRKAPKVE